MSANDLYETIQPGPIRGDDKIQVMQIRFRFNNNEDNQLTLVELMLKYADILRKEYTIPRGTE